MSDEETKVDQDEQVDQPVEAESDVETPEEELSEEEQEMAKLKEAIIVEKEELGSLRLKLTVTIPAETLDERRGSQFAELKRDATVPGFRRGHAPMELVEKRFASDVGEQLKGQLFGSGYMAAVEKEDLKPLGNPLFWVKVTEEHVDEKRATKKVETEKLLPIDKAMDHLDMPKSGALTFSCEIELKPEFELPELKGIPVKRPKISIGDDDVETEITRMQSWRGTYQPVDEGTTQADDMIYADVKMSVDGNVIETEENTDLAIRDVRVKGVPLQGFGDSAAGKKLGDVVTIEATVPDDHENIDIRGKTATFEVTIREIKRLEIPPMDEEFLSAVGFESEADLRTFVRSSLESRLDQTIGEAMRSQVGLYLVENTELEIPEGLSQRQTDRAVARRMIEMYQAGIPEADANKMADEFRTTAHEQTVKDLKLFFLLERIADEQEIEVTEEQMNGAIAQMAKQSNKRFDRMRDELSKGDGLAMLHIQLRERQVLEALLADAEITEMEAPKEEKKKAAPKKKAKTAKKKAAGKKTETKKKKATTKKTAKKKTS